MEVHDLLLEVQEEIKRAGKAHGPLTQNHQDASLILCRESLEALQEAGEMKSIPVLSPEYIAKRMKLRAELIQVIAVAALWIGNIDRARGKEGG